MGWVQEMHLARGGMGRLRCAVGEFFSGHDEPQRSCRVCRFIFGLKPVWGAVCSCRGWASHLGHVQHKRHPGTGHATDDF